MIPLQFDLKLKTVSPVFIGDGNSITKKTYLYDNQKGTVSIFDEEKLFRLILEKNLVDRFEAYMLNRNGDLRRFLTNDCCISESDWSNAVRYRLKVGDAIDAEHSLKEIKSFIRDASGHVYIPGSSIKGALRTVILHKMIIDEGKTGNNQLNDSSYSNGLGDIPEDRYLNKLSLPKNTKDMLKSIMRGVRISDSLSIDDKNMILAIKHDVHTDGSVGKLNVCRECIRPGTEIKMNLSLDHRITEGIITTDYIKKALICFSNDYYDKYLMKFSPPENEADIPFQDSQYLFIGGGSGFFTKSLLYPYLGEDRALGVVSEYMQKKFKNHKHEIDAAELGISPHTLKYTEYNGKLYHMGICEVDII